MSVRHWGWAVMAAVVLLASCGHKAHMRGHQGERVNTLARVVYAAEQQVGAPYQWGGESPAGFDCSGLIRYVYGSVGVTVPHSTEGLLDRVSRVSLAQALPGDILFFKVDPPKVSHVGLYIGDNRFVHAPKSGSTVSYGSLDNRYWRSHLSAVGRVF